MALERMYPPQKDSPSTYLLGDIGTNDTYISVGNADVLPNVVPFPLTLGFDKSITETVIVTNIGNGNNQLTVTRGDNPLSWFAGTKCARVFTSSDLLSVQRNIATNHEQIVTNTENIAEHYAELSESIASEITRAQGVEDNIVSVKVNREELSRVLTNVNIDGTSTTIALTFITYDAETKSSGQIVRNIPIVTSSNAGVITPEDYAEIGYLRNDINALQQQGGKFIGQSFSTYSDLLAFDIPSSVNIGDFTYVLDDEGHSDATTRYIYNGVEFEFAYVINYDPVGMATPDTPGVVLSDDGTSNGKVVVEISGLMRVVGWDDIVNDINTIKNENAQLYDDFNRLITEHKAYQPLEDSNGNKITDSNGENIQGQFIYVIK